MDGPNVNKLFLTMLNEERQTNELSTLIDIGNCGLHTINGSLQIVIIITTKTITTLYSSYKLEYKEVIVFNVPNIS